MKFTRNAARRRAIEPIDALPTGQGRSRPRIEFGGLAVGAWPLGLLRMSEGARRATGVPRMRQHIGEV